MSRACLNSSQLHNCNSPPHYRRLPATRAPALAARAPKGPNPRCWPPCRSRRATRCVRFDAGPYRSCFTLAHRMPAHPTLPRPPTTQPPPTHPHPHTQPPHPQPHPTPHHQHQDEPIELMSDDDEGAGAAAAQPAAQPAAAATERGRRHKIPRGGRGPYVPPGQRFAVGVVQGRLACRGVSWVAHRCLESAVSRPYVPYLQLQLQATVVTPPHPPTPHPRNHTSHHHRRYRASAASTPPWGAALPWRWWRTTSTGWRRMSF